MKTIIIAGSLFLVLFIACKKGDNDNTGSQWKVPKIKTQTEGSGNPVTFHYDNEGRLIKAEGGTLNREYKYQPSQVTHKITDLASGGISIELYQLNAEGYVSNRGNTTYAYTPEGYVKNMVKNGSNGAAEFYQYYYNAASKLLDSVVLMKGSNWFQTTIYTYYTDTDETTGNDNSGLGFFGKSLPHPVKSATYWIPKQGIPNREVWRTENYSYLQDEAGRIVKTNASTVSFGQSSSTVTIYTYH